VFMLMGLWMAVFRLKGEENVCCCLKRGHFMGLGSTLSGSWKEYWVGIAFVGVLAN
jgi:hypothetical protein